MSLIKDGNNGIVQTEKKKIEHLGKTRKLDRPGNLISPLLSIIEGQLGEPESVTEKQVTQKKEYQAIRLFFRLAVTDSDHLDVASQELAEAFAGNINFRSEARSSFLQCVAPMIATGVEKRGRNKIENRIIQSAHECSLPTSDPLVVLALACLYGSAHARRVLKPHSPRIFNVLSDIHVIPRMLLVVAAVRRHAPLIRVRFATKDEGLKYVLQRIYYRSPQLTADREISCGMHYSPSLFPDLTQDAFCTLMEKTMAATNHSRQPSATQPLTTALH
ncbi:MULTISPECIES: hypothetical protein [unclassified Caballeronia]|uniref:hypothetical protein n=1 Tax=unclassified Caballeronia TaxID=2646786 RepID=UPI002863097C|nr:MULTISPECIES: hypothetical protein [unclassified Caballeronia]MDR5737423.1 hypothetical protein [Caballeronia sp. LZ016]MDR5810048.1 hypothetical protein [Caballeronia sp. LZ019]